MTTIRQCPVAASTLLLSLIVLIISPGRRSLPGTPFSENRMA